MLYKSERLSLYEKHSKDLIAEDKAYRCFCSPEDLEQHKRTAHENGLSTHYPGTCRSVSHEESEERAARGDPFAVRFKSAKEPVSFNDIVYHRFKKAVPEEDFVIMKRDGFPTYHFANVVDDKHMEITHVVRGAEWLLSTPKHVELYNAFEWTPPAFAHVGLLVDKNGQKLSKRDLGADITWYKQEKILPEALLNFSALLGWRGKPGGDDMSLQDMIKNVRMTQRISPH